MVSRVKEYLPIIILILGLWFAASLPIVTAVYDSINIGTLLHIMQDTEYFSKQYPCNPYCG